MENTVGTPASALQDAIAILNAANYAAAVSWAGGITGHASVYLQGDDIRYRVRFSEFLFRPDGDKFYTGPEQLHSAQRILADLKKVPSTPSWALMILDNAYDYLNGKDITVFYRATTRYFEGLYSHPVEQLALPCSEETDEAEPGMVDCCTGDHEYEKGTDPDCDCFTAECNCEINPENTGICSRCDYCNDCCSNNGECYHCDSCDRVGDGDDICGKCESTCKKCCDKHFYCGGCNKYRSTDEQCSSCSDCQHGCCECWYCEHCNDSYSSDVPQCSTCNHCAEGCCECNYCQACEERHESDVAFCTDCDCCEDNCTCGACKGCDVKPEDVDQDKYCTACKRCGNCGCNCPPPPFTAKTQKARGLQALKTYSKYNVPYFTLAKASTVGYMSLVGKFVRPCPMHPRHGFVDSRLVSTEEDAQLIIKQTLAADADAEFILMTKLAAQFSGVWTPGLMVLGPGNDGATAGRKSITVQVGGRFVTEQSLLQLAGITESPYVELIWTDSQVPQAVQLRNGPALPQQIDAISVETTVTKVVLAEGDLLEWETLMKSQPAGTVVYHPDGSLASHYAVHAVLNNIPVLISREPKVGEVIVPSVDAVAPDMDKVRAGFHYALTSAASYNEACYMMLLGVHSTTIWIGKQDALLGAALGFAYRLSVTAALGEWRHKPGQTEKEYDKKPSRESVYEKAWMKSHKTRGSYMQALKDFRTLSWPSGMGGEKWFQFTRWAAVIMNSVLSGDLVAALAAMNNAVHSSHNNGWGFNKFADSEAMNRVAANPVHAFTYCARLVYSVAKESHTTGNKHKAIHWFSVARPLPVQQAEKWVRRSLDEVNAKNAAVAQFKVEGDKLRVQYKPRDNSGLFSEELLSLPSDAMEKVTKRFLTAKEDGRVVPSFSDSEEEKYLPLTNGFNPNVHSQPFVGRPWKLGVGSFEFIQIENLNSEVA